MQRARRADGGVRGVAAALKELRVRERRHASGGCSSPTTTRSIACCWHRNLELMGHRVAAAENGRVALDMLRREPFDLLLLDMEMPEMDGFQVLEQLASDLALRDLPVIVTSSLEGLDNVVRCIELGAEDYLPKPVNPCCSRRASAQAWKRSGCATSRRAGAALRDAGSRPGPAGVGVCAGRQARRGHGDVLGHPRLHAAGESQPPEETIELLIPYYTLMFDAISGHGGIVSHIVGDGLMAVFGAPLPLPDHCDAAVRAALEMVEMIDSSTSSGPRRQAAHSRRHRHRLGEMVAGYTGTNERATYTASATRERRRAPRGAHQGGAASRSSSTSQHEPACAARFVSSRSDPCRFGARRAPWTSSASSRAPDVVMIGARPSCPAPTAFSISSRSCAATAIR
jgi:CheY-like chemotaxis protein